jgi:hypothetical protein
VTAGITIISPASTFKSWGDGRTIARMKPTKHPLVAAVAAAAGALGFAVLALGAGTVAAISPLPPSITVKPNNVMVNTNTTVTGRNFGPHQRVMLAECSRTAWIVPQNACDTNNGKTVVANALGAFVTTMKVEGCPAVVPGIAEQCYIGQPKPTGIDTVALRPFAGIVVTFP